MTECLNVYRATQPGASPCQKCGVDTHGEREARAYNGGLGTELPAGSRGRAPGQGVRGQSPPEAENLLAFGCPTSSKFASFSVFCKLLKSQVFVIHLSKN